MRIGLITNLRSQRNKRRALAQFDTPAGGPEVLQRHLDGIEGLAETLAEFAMAGVEVVAVNGGDGTVSRVLTELQERSPFERLPRLALLPGGMTNMCAADVGIRGARSRTLGRLLATAAAGDLDSSTVVRETIRLRRGAESRPVHGMFFGTAAITRAIQTCRKLVHPLKIESSAASGATLAYLLLCRLFRRNGGDPVIRGDDIRVNIDNGPPQELTQLLALVTTLDRLVLGSRPFWGAGEGALHYTGLAYPPNRLLRSAYRVLYGGDDRRLPEPHYVSRNANRISFEMSCPFTLDGEIFEPLPSTPVELNRGGPVRFLRC